MRIAAWVSAAAIAVLGAGAASAQQLAPEQLALAPVLPKFAKPGDTRCVAEKCSIRLTASQLLAKAEQLVLAHQFDEAAPLLAALENAPQLSMERDFLIGYTQVENGRLDDAIKTFRKILNSNPAQTRVRMELGRALMMRGKSLSAEHHFRLAAQDKSLPDDVARTVRATRGVLRNADHDNFSIDVGLAPDSNITNGTNADTVTVSLGPITVPLTLDEAAKQKSGTGQFVNFAGSKRLGLAGETRLLIETSSQATNYAGKDFDDIAVELAVGPERDIGSDTTLSIQALGAQRWYGGKSATTAYGIRAGLQSEVGDGQRLGFTLDARRSESGFTALYSGWQLGGFATYERVIGRRFIASATLFGRRDELNAATFASTELGGNLGVGGELPLGLNASVSAGASRAAFDKPLTFLSPDARTDWRLNARVSLGLRSLRMAGFSPSVSYSYSASLSSLSLYDSKRSRLRFALARYF
jgi:outer membrane protein